jgi:AraC family transcriptional regulator, regulatory protein of adaptative response / methylated-DNA-[protein]-cysteine methyltransferase
LIIAAPRRELERKNRSAPAVQTSHFGAWTKGKTKMADSMTRTEADPRWRFVADRDASADCAFVYAVKTTGVYCRPSCPSRSAKPENVCFFANGAEAEAAGYRACRRCRPNAAAPNEETIAKIAEACRRLDSAEELPSLERLAADADLSPSHFHRRFKAVTGLTPKAYGAARRAERLRAELSRKNASITPAIYAAGYASNSRFYETSDRLLGMTPTAFKNGGENAEISFAVGECSLGSILVAATGRGVCAIFIGGDPDGLARELQSRFPKADFIGDDREFGELVARVVGFVEAPKIGLDLPLDMRGTAFQRRVWQALRDIPVGKTASYAEIARRIGAPKSVRAVARACGANHIAVAIPCHRVVRTDGGLSGYRWGVERKRALLDRESDP